MVGTHGIVHGSVDCESSAKVVLNFGGAWGRVSDTASDFSNRVMKTRD